MTEAPAPTIRSVAAPLAGSLIFTLCVVSLLCKPPQGPSLSWPLVIALALLDVGIALGTQAAILYLLQAIFPAHIELSAKTLLLGSWISAAWMPLFVLLLREQSVWSAAVPPLIVAPAVLSIRRWTTQAHDETAIAAVDASRLFRIEEPPSFVRTVLPAALTSIALQAGVGALLLDYSATAGLLFSACVLLPIWRYPIKPVQGTSEPKNLAEMQPLIRDVVVVILLTGVALLPFLKNQHLGIGMGAFLQTRHSAPSMSSLRKVALKTHAGGSYSGVILYLPQKPRKQIIAPDAAAKSMFDRAHPKPVIIPFDGVYWYFQPPDDRPEQDARIIHGDPAKTSIHATDRLPILMEAHQYLGSSIQMNCCRSLRMQLKNSDNRPGAIYLEIYLRDTTRKDSLPTSLGTLAIPSSLVPSSSTRLVLPDRHPVEETLNFPIPARPGTRQFDEITVKVEPSQERSLVGARIAIEQFVLVP